MVAYIQRIADELSNMLDRAWREPIVPLASRLVTLQEEVEKLDPRDFLPERRFDFVEARRRLRCLASTTQDDWDETLSRWRKGNIDQDGTTLETEIEICARICQQVRSALDAYRGPGSRAIVRSFDFVKDNVLRGIVERDYSELKQIFLPDCAWKSVVVMAGSILEAILFDLLTQTPERVAQAMASPDAPKKREKGVGGGVKSLTGDEWVLADLIKVAVDLGLLPKEREDAIDEALRAYRNLIHPRREVDRRHPPGESEGSMAWGGLLGVCDHLERAAAGS
jgi:hypothetical protein